MTARQEIEFEQERERILEEYSQKLRQIEDSDEFVELEISTTFGIEDAKHMIRFLDENPGCRMRDFCLEKVDYYHMVKEKQNKSAVMGFVVGDALGVPVEFVSRSELHMKPVTGMREYGTHNQPRGTWSDDSSMMIATMEWLDEMGDNDEWPVKYRYKPLMDRFLAWLLHGEYAPYGEVFDCGVSVRKALSRYQQGCEALASGGRTEYDNGNGSLMRILPLGLWLSEELAFRNVEEADVVFNVSKLTHAHMRSQIGCLLYSKIIADMMHMPDEDKFEVLDVSLSYSKEYLEQQEDKEILAEIETFGRIWDLERFVSLPEEEIKSSGYVVDSLEAALWCFLNTDNYRECVLKAVNLGDDTDTVGALAGGLAGLYYGSESIPAEWMECIPKKEWIQELAESVNMF